MPVLRCDVITLFPDLVHLVLGQRLLKRAQNKGLLEVASDLLGVCRSGAEFVGDGR